MYLIGDRVRTRNGAGLVVDRRTWRDAVVDMDDVEAVSFSAHCKSRYGEGYRESYQSLLVTLDVPTRRGVTMEWVESVEVEREQAVEVAESGSRVGGKESRDSR